MLDFWGAKFSKFDFFTFTLIYAELTLSKNCKGYQNSKHIFILVIWIEISYFNPKLTEFLERVQSVEIPSIQRLSKNLSQNLYQKWQFAKKIIKTLSKHCPKKTIKKTVQKKSSLKLSNKLSKKSITFFSSEADRINYGMFSILSSWGKMNICFQFW